MVFVVDVKSELDVNKERESSVIRKDEKGRGGIKQKRKKRNRRQSKYVIR